MQYRSRPYRLARYYLLLASLFAVLSGCARDMQVQPSQPPYQSVDPVEATTSPAPEHVKRAIGKASYYGAQFHGKKTASGEKYDKHRFTAAHPTLPFNTRVKVRNLANGKAVVVRINDRGPFHGNRIIDLSRAAATALGMLHPGVTDVELEELH